MPSPPDRPRAPLAPPRPDSQVSHSIRRAALHSYSTAVDPGGHVVHRRADPGLRLRQRAHDRLGRRRHRHAMPATAMACAPRRADALRGRSVVQSCAARTATRRPLPLQGDRARSPLASLAPPTIRSATPRPGSSPASLGALRWNLHGPGWIRRCYPCPHGAYVWRPTICVRVSPHCDARRMRRSGRCQAAHCRGSSQARSLMRSFMTLLAHHGMA
jgi:hypothetical protein